MAAGDTQITIAGNLVDDPELRYTPTGQAVAKFRVASTPRYRDNASGEWKDGDSLFLTCNVWRQAAENVVVDMTACAYPASCGTVGPRPAGFCSVARTGTSSSRAASASRAARATTASWSWMTGMSRSCRSISSRTAPSRLSTIFLTLLHLRCCGQKCRWSGAG